MWFCSTFAHFISRICFHFHFSCKKTAIFILIFVKLRIYLINMSDYEYVRLNFIVIFNALFIRTLMTYGWVRTWLCLKFDPLFSYIKPTFSLLKSISQYSSVFLYSQCIMSRPQFPMAPLPPTPPPSTIQEFPFLLLLPFSHILQ